jgi:hypothetical protein
MADNSKVLGTEYIDLKCMLFKGLEAQHFGNDANAHREQGCCQQRQAAFRVAFTGTRCHRSNQYSGFGAKWPAKSYF